MTLKKLLQKQEKKMTVLSPQAIVAEVFFLNKIKALIYTMTETDLIYIYGTLK